MDEVNKLIGQADGVLTEDRNRTWTASELGRRLKVTTQTAGTVLDKLTELGYATNDNRGCWTRWSAA